LADHTNFPADYPFYGGISPAYGTGLHEDRDSTTGKVEPIKADYINRIEYRIANLEYIVNQIEHEILYPSGSIDTTLDVDIPASGEYYLTSRIDMLASTLNSLIDRLETHALITPDDVPYHPLHE